MNVKKLSQSGTGKLVKVPQGYWAFVPNPLPPAIEFSPKLVNALPEADRTLGALEGRGRTLPNRTLERAYTIGFASIHVATANEKSAKLSLFGFHLSFAHIDGNAL